MERVVMRWCSDFDRRCDAAPQPPPRRARAVADAPCSTAKLTSASAAPTAASPCSLTPIFALLNDRV